MIYLLQHTIQESAKKHPEKTAFSFGNQSLTYQELVIKSNQLANYLIEKGIQRGDRVGIFMNRCLESAIAIYGILQAGAAYVPLDPFAPKERTKFQVEDCGIKFIITVPIIARSLKEMPIKGVVGVEQEQFQTSISWKQLFERSPQPIERTILEKDLAYVMYTSGTTGKPKGIMHTHFSGLSYARLSAHLYKLTSADIIGNHCALHYDISTFGFFTAPLVGATTVICSEGHVKMPASLSQLMEQQNITVWYSVPLALIQLLQRGLLENRDLSALRWVLFGGEPLPTKHLQALMDYMPNATFSNVYGPAEVNQCTYYHISEKPESEEPLPLGYVWENTEMLIFDRNDQPVPKEEVGELLIRSSTMMRGYWGRPDLTEKGFYIHQHSPGYSSIFYRTGDLVQLNAQGELLFLGRKDRQIKIRGHRVELTEIEVMLLQHDLVDEAAVYDLRLPDEVFIEAIITLKADLENPEHALIQHLKKLLPSHFIPKTIKIVDEIPRTSAGKIDHKSLQEAARKLLPS